MPDSSIAGVRRVLVTHMEDEDDQENEKEQFRPARVVDQCRI